MTKFCVKDSITENQNVLQKAVVFELRGAKSMQK